MKHTSFLLVSAALVVGSAIHSVPAGAPAVKSRPDVIIHDGTYPGWPWIAADKDGTLYCAFREGTEHGYSPSGKAMLGKSSDGGKTWSKATVIVDAPDVDDRNVAITVLPNKDLLVVYNTYTKARASLAMTIRSKDGGKTWGKPKPVGEPNTRTRAAALVLADGTLVLPYYIAPGNGALAALSKDDGATWKTVRVPDSDGFVGDEWDVFEMERGHIVGLIRNSHPKTDGTFWVTQSKDAGKTWSTPKRTNVQSKRHPSPPHLAKQGKTPILIYADRRMVSVSAVKPLGNDLSRWDLQHRLPCYLYNADESPIVDGSYPASAPVGPRQRLIVDYEIRKDSRRITGYFVTFPEQW